jgi:exopolyphosphatase/guanosine-5'-triphosphate,3'-diphosphate pyrophosphatase
MYLLSATSDSSVKFRDAVMDVKRLEAVNEDGLEQWKPIMKAEFPLSASDVGGVLEALDTASPELSRDAYTLEQLVAGMVEPNADLRAVEVHKERRHYSVGGCMAEVSEVRTGNGSRRTIAVESPDPALVIAAVRDLGLASRPNVNMSRGLKALVGVGVRRYAVIDVGTNSVKFHVGERLADGEWRTLVDRAEITRLGEGLDETGRLNEEPIARTVEAIVAMADEAKRCGAAEIAAVGTAGLRIAPNSADLISAVRDRIGVEIEVISGDEEGRLSYLAAKSSLGRVEGTLCVFETGGGSSQFTFGEGARVDERFSVDVGAARFTERFGLDGPVSEETLGAALDAIAADLDRLDGRPAPGTLVGLGGALTNLAAVKHALETYDPDVVQGTVLNLAEIGRQIERYRTRSSDERREIVGLQPKRAEVILAGACIVRTVMTKLQRDWLVVSDRGLRHGLLVERFGS